MGEWRRVNNNLNLKKEISGNECEQVFKAARLLVFLLTLTNGMVMAQDLFVFGEPLSGFFADRGILVRANGPVFTDERATEAPSRLVQVVSKSIRMGEPNATELTGAYPEAIIGQPEVQADGEVTAFAQGGGKERTN